MILTSDLLDAVVRVAEEAGKKILSVYHRSEGDIGITEKDDGSPLTRADLLAHQSISDGLNVLTPTIPVLSEESKEIDIQRRHQWPILWMVDPLDGTKEFIHRTDEFTVNIALIINHQPVLGVVHAPALGITYFAMEGYGAYKTEKGSSVQTTLSLTKVSYEYLTPLRIVASRRHGGDALEKFLQQIPQYTLVNAGSALKICLVAEGVADLYPRLGPTSEWDTAAGHAIINAAGGVLYDSKKRPFCYNMRNTLLNGSFVVSHAAAPRFDFCSN